MRRRPKCNRHLSTTAEHMDARHRLRHLITMATVTVGQAIIRTTGRDSQSSLGQDFTVQDSSVLGLTIAAAIIAVDFADVDGSRIGLRQNQPLFVAK